MATYPSDPVARLLERDNLLRRPHRARWLLQCGHRHRVRPQIGQTLSWWNPAAQAWQKVSPQSAVNATGCITASLSGSSSPTVAQLVGTVFATTKVPHTDDNKDASSPASRPAKTAGYDMVGSDGGVFVFPDRDQSGGFFGSLPGLGVNVNNIVGMVPTATDQGYFLVGSDGGVFAFGNAPFLGSLPGLRRRTHPAHHRHRGRRHRQGLLPGGQGRRGLRLRHSARSWGRCRGAGIHRSTTSSASPPPPRATATGWSPPTGTVYGFGAAQGLGTAKGTSSPVSAIAGTPTGGGYWITTKNGTVYAFGNAKSFGTLPALGVTPAYPVIGIVHTADTGGYWLIGADGGSSPSVTPASWGRSPGSQCTSPTS